MSPLSNQRLTAAERTDQLVEAAIQAFAVGGYAGTTTGDVADLAGVTQPYVIRLFGTKQRLFIAALERAIERIELAFTAVGPADLASLAPAYDRLLAERDLLAVLLHGFAASSEPAIGTVVRERFGRIYRLIRELSGADAREVSNFLATGMLLTVLAAMRAIGPGAAAPEAWTTELIGTLGQLDIE